MLDQWGGSERYSMIRNAFEASARNRRDGRLSGSYRQIHL